MSAMKAALTSMGALAVVVALCAIGYGIYLADQDARHDHAARKATMARMLDRANRVCGSKPVVIDVRRDSGLRWVDVECPDGTHRAVLP